MSPWQLRQHKHSQLWVRLLTISLMAHGIIVLLLLVMYRGYATDYRIHIGVPVHNQASKVVFVPLAKSIQPGKSGGKKAGGTTSASKSSGSGPAAKTAKAKKNTTVVSPRKSKKEAAKQARKPVDKKKNKPVQKKKVKKPEPVKKAVKKEPEKVVPKKVTAVKNSSTSSECLIKEPEKIVEKAVTQPTEQVTQEAVVPVAQESIGDATQDVLYIGQREYDALQMEELIRQEIEQQWRPPAGLSKDLVCEIDVLVGWDGKASVVEIKQKSGVLMYDTYARSTVLAMNFPRAACGKQLCMHFKQ